MLDLTPAVSQAGDVGKQRGIARLPSFSSTQLSKMSVEQRKMRLKQNLLPNRNDVQGSQPNNLPTEKSAAAFKKNSAAKPANSFPSMEDQLKDLLKGNSEESLIAPGHNSTRFHLDYTNADGSGYVPSALEQQPPRHSYPARNDNAESHYGNEMS